MIGGAERHEVMPPGDQRGSLLHARNLQRFPLPPNSPLRENVSRTRYLLPAMVFAAILTGREKGRARDSMLASLASGLTPVVVGTHALVQPELAASPKLD